MRGAAPREPCTPWRNRHAPAYGSVYRRGGYFPVYGKDDKKVATDIHDDGGEVRVVLRGGKTL